MKKHFLGFIYFLFMWIVGGTLIDVLLSFAFGDLLSRYTAFIGFVAGIYVWYRTVKQPKVRGVA